MAAPDTRPETTPHAGEERKLRPYLELSARQRDTVAGHLRARRARCAGCGSGDFEIGEALYLGFLFQNEDLDAYMVALTCSTPGCGALTGIKLPGPDFL